MKFSVAKIINSLTLDRVYDPWEEISNGLRIWMNNEKLSSIITVEEIEFI